MVNPTCSVIALVDTRHQSDTEGIVGTVISLHEAVADSWKARELWQQKMSEVGSSNPTVAKIVRLNRHLESGDWVSLSDLARMALEDHTANREDG
jgi:hypothetical protein